MRFSHLNMTLLKVKQEYFEAAILIPLNFFRLLLRLKVIRSITLKYLCHSNPSRVMQLFNSYFSVGAASRHF